MVAWLLVAVVASGNEVVTKPFGIFIEMTDCFEGRDLLLAQAPQPKINYEVLCVKVNGQPLS